MKKLPIFATALGLILMFSATPVFASENVYTVKGGDTLSEIASEYNIDLKDLANANPQISNIDLIFIGEEINLSTLEVTYAEPEAYVEYEDLILPEAQTQINTTERDLLTEAATVGFADRDLFAQIVHAEANGESYIGKVAVAEVILNRVNSPEFPNTISGVIYQPGQFSPVADGSLYNTPAADDYAAVDEAMQGGDITGGALFFYNPAVSGANWLDSLTTSTVIGNHVFKY